MIEELRVPFPDLTLKSPARVTGDPGRAPDYCCEPRQQGCLWPAPAAGWEAEQQSQETGHGGKEE